MPAAPVQNKLLADRLPQWTERTHREVSPLGKALHRALRARAELADLKATNTLRLLDGEGLPRFVDLYGNRAVLHSWADLDPGDQGGVDQHLAQLKLEARALGDWLDLEAVWVKARPPQTNELADPARLAPAKPAFGDAPGSLVVREAGMGLQVQLDRGLATGIYLDQRDNRRWVRGEARGLRVLNTFCYTAAFTVAAALGGAARTVSIDASAPALEWADKNLTLNGFSDRSAHDLVRGDTLQWLAKLARRGDRFDLIILDPPSHSTVKGKRWSALQRYRELVGLACAALAPGGRILACINAAGVEDRRLAQWVQEGAERAGRRPTQLRDMAPQTDFPSGRMKSVLATLG